MKQRGSRQVPFTKKNRFITFLVCMSLAFVINATYVATLHDGNMTPTQERIVTACLLGATFAAGFARLEYIARKTKHDLRSDVNTVGLYAQHAAKQAESAATEAREAAETMPARVVEKINGGLDRAAKRALDESPFPTSHDELVKFVQSVQSVNCEEMIDRALARAKEKGWQPPQDTTTT